jgi:hypothetical protein
MNLAIKTMNIFGARAIANLPIVAKIAPTLKIGNFFLKMSIINPAKHFVIKENKTTDPSKKPNDLLFPPSSLTINIGNREEIMDDAIPQAKCIQQIHIIVLSTVFVADTKKKFFKFTVAPIRILNIKSTLKIKFLLFNFTNLIKWHAITQNI